MLDVPITRTELDGDSVEPANVDSGVTLSAALGNDAFELTTTAAV
jgi:hypothetical protein